METITANNVINNLENFHVLGNNQTSWEDSKSEYIFEVIFTCVCQVLDKSEGE